MSEPQPLLAVRGLKKYFPIKTGLLQAVTGHVRAVEEVTFDLYPGECLGLAGESGSGKTTLGRVILRALEPTAGQVLFRPNVQAGPPSPFQGEGRVRVSLSSGAEARPAPPPSPRRGEGEPGAAGQAVDLTRASPRQLKPLRRHMQMIFQDPYSSLNPRMTVLDIVGEPLLVNGLRNRRERERQVRQLLNEVGLKPQHLRRYPHAFSGGERQRIGIARALALKPRLIVADEPVSALDVSVQAQVLNLLQDLQERFGLTYLLIAHNLSVLRHVADRVAVMYVGRLIELADTEALFLRPRHPYTEALLAASPVPDPDHRPAQALLAGEVPDPSSPPPGCPFHPRCRYAQALCAAQVPEFREIEKGHLVRCHLAERLDLKGIRI